MRVLAIAVLAVLAGAAAAQVPSAAAVAPIPVATEGETRIVASHLLYDHFWGTSCSSFDPYTRDVATDLTSTLHRVPEGGAYRYTLRLDAAFYPLSSSGGVPTLCMMPLEVEGVASVTWPQDHGYASSSFHMACGGQATLRLYAGGGTRGGEIHFHDVPLTCGLPFFGHIEFHLNDVQHGAQICTPVVLSGCTGVRTMSTPDRFCGGAPFPEHHLDVAGIPLLSYWESCYPWEGGERASHFADRVGIVSLRTTDSSCSVLLLPVLGGAHPTRCPAGDDILRSHPWRHVFEALA